MDINKSNFKWLLWGIMTLSPILIAFILIWLNCNLMPSESLTPWLVLVQSFGSLLLIILIVGLTYHFYIKMVEALNRQQLDLEKLRQEMKLAETHNQFRYQKEKGELILRLIEKFSIKIESAEKVEKKETKTITLIFKKELLDDIEYIKTKWDEITG